MRSRFDQTIFSRIQSSENLAVWALKSLPLWYFTPFRSSNRHWLSPSRFHAVASPGASSMSGVTNTSCS